MWWHTTDSVQAIDKTIMDKFLAKFCHIGLGGHNKQ